MMLDCGLVVRKVVVGVGVGVGVDGGSSAATSQNLHHASLADVDVVGR